MKYLKEKICLFVLLSFAVSKSSSQKLAGVFHFEKFTVSEGLSGNQVQSIFQDSRGFLWIGTNGGLSRYDGRTFKKYPTSNTNFTDPNISCIAEDADGNIWVGTESGLNKIDPFTEQVTKYNMGEGPGSIPYKWCNALYLDKRKNFWLSTEKGLAVYEKETNSFINYPIEVFGKDARINKSIARMFEDSKGRFWLATSYGMKLFDRATKKYESFYRSDPLSQPLLANEFRSIAEDKQGHIWVGTYAGGLFQYNESRQKFENTEVPGIDIGRFVIEDILPVRLADKDYLLLATIEGILCIEYTGTTLLPTKLIRSEYLPPPYYVSKFLLDKEKNLWWGGSKGLMKMSAERFAYQWQAIESADGQRPFIFHMIPDIKEPGSVFYLSAIEGWWKYDATTGNITKHPLPGNENNRLRTINRWYPDKNGYWFTAVQGFGYYDIYKNQFTDLSSIPEGMTGQRTTGFIAKDQEGKFWVSLRRSGIMVFDPVTRKAEQLFADTSKPETAYGSSITDLQTGPDGHIYFCAARRLYRVNPADRSFKIFTSPVFPEPVDNDKLTPHKIFFTKDKRTIVFSQLRIYELKNEQLVSIYPATGLCDFMIENIVKGYEETIWVTTRRTIFKTTASFLQWIDQGPLLGLEPDQLPFEIYASVPGKILFTGEGGIGVLNELALTEKRSIPPVIISRVKYGNKESFLVSEKSPAIKTSYKNAIEIEVSPVSYASKIENRILYRLEGWDEEWKELNSLSPLRYEQLPPGKYSFKTKSVTGNETESKESVFSFRITPPFYRTWWFVSLIILVIGSSIFLFYRYRLNAALKMERLRTRIATDLHDDIGATLSSISMYSEALKGQVKEQLPHLEPVLNKMGENSRDMVNSMSDIVWAINPGNDNGEKLAQRMESHARDVCAIKNISLNFSCDNSMSDIKLPLEYRKNIYLIFKEGLNNALKYSGATEITVKISRENNSLQLIVKDNGKGFDINETKKGNGLKNMEQRAKEIRSTLQLNAVPGKGTLVELNCPIS